MLPMSPRRTACRPEALSDSQLLTRVIDAKAAEFGDVDKALDDVLPQLEGAYCLTILDGKSQRIIGVRDPWGYHPLVLGSTADGGHVLASETAALDRSGAQFVRDIEPGEIVTISEAGVESRFIGRVEKPQHCMFEYVYTASPTSVIDERSVYMARKNMGKALARQHPVEADIVVGVPESGLPIAAGYAEQSGLPQVQGIIKNPYSVRSFILEGQSREEALRAKLTPNPYEIDGKRLVLADDSIIKGNTMRSFTHMLREAGAMAVHIMSGAPRYEFVCRMGMDTGDASQLVARGRTNDEIAALIGADSVSFNTPEDVEWAINEARIPGGKEWPVGALCTACATGDYALKSRTFQQIAAEKQAIDLGMPAVPARA
jgi:amidophosphoribosyltransferase